MATLLEELETTWAAPSKTLVPGGLPPLPDQPPASMLDELEQTWGSQEPAAASNLPGVGSGIVAIKDWLQKNPQTALDLAIQSLTTGMGIAAGTPAGPPGMMVGGAAGNVAGRGVSRDLGRVLGFNNDGPAEIASPETATDAGLGAVGPAASLVAKGARPLTRFIGGMPNRATRKNIADDAIDTVMSAPLADHRVQYKELVRANIRERMPRGPLSEAGLASTVTAGALDGVMTAGIVAGLNTLARGGRAVIANRLLTNDRFFDWALKMRAPGLSTPAQIATSLAAVLADKGLTDQERSDFHAFQAAISQDNAIAEGGLSFDENVERWRGPGGRFAAPHIDHDGQPIRHGESLDGSLPTHEENER